MQEIKAFMYGHDPLTPGSYEYTSLEKQINTYLAFHPNYTAKSMNVVIGNGYKEAFVIFDISEVTPSVSKGNEKTEIPKNTKNVVTKENKDKQRS